MTAPEKHKVVDVVRDEADALDTTPAAIAVAWLAAQSAVGSILLGPSSVAQLDETMAACDLTLSADSLGRLDRASAPEPGMVNGIPRVVQAAS